MSKDDLTPKDPHDRLFKRVMSDEANVRKFIKEFLPKDISSQINLREIKLIPTEKIKGYNKYYIGHSRRMPYIKYKRTALFRIRA